MGSAESLKDKDKSTVGNKIQYTSKPIRPKKCSKIPVETRF
jgi:hypothetical protein